MIYHIISYTYKPKPALYKKQYFIVKKYIFFYLCPYTTYMIKLKTLMITDKTHKKLKSYCLKNNLKMKGIADQIINQYLAKQDGQSTR